MIKKGTYLNIADNSGAQLVQCINQNKDSSKVGDIIKITVKKSKKGKVQPGSTTNAVITQTVKKFKRLDGSQLYFDQNKCVLLNLKNLPLASRITSYVTYELRIKKFTRILSLARFIL